jgi:hypothetical protein
MMPIFGLRIEPSLGYSKEQKDALYTYHSFINPMAVRFTLQRSSGIYFPKEGLDVFIKNRVRDDLKTKSGVAMKCWVVDMAEGEVDGGGSVLSSASWILSSRFCVKAVLTHRILNQICQPGSGEDLTMPTTYLIKCYYI